MRPAILAVILALGSRGLAAQVDTVLGPLARPVGVDTTIPKRPLMAIAQALSVNVLVNRVDALLLGYDWARASLNTWRSNLRLGWEWDEDGFRTNMFGHPYHGGLYFNAARDNGLDFWGSAPVAFLGSWTWEYLGETYRPSLNDFFMTSFGGIALGEVVHRLSATVRDNTARGGRRLRRELMALPLDPIGGLNRLMRGEWRAVGPNPPEHDPGAFALRVQAGARFTRGFVSDSLARLPALVVDLVYGDPFLRPYRAPFDAFSLRAVLSGAGGFNVLRGSGRVYSRELGDTGGRSRHQFMINQRYDYISNPAQSIGGQSVELGLNSRWLLGARGLGIRTSIFTDVILMGAIDAPGSGLGERNYDFGPGAGARTQVSLEHRGLRFLTLFGQLEFVHAVSGASADHLIVFGGAELTIPIARGFGVSVHATNFNRVSHYSDRPDDRRDYPELRILAAWTRFGFSRAP
jgi:hypothetical protein